MSADFSTTLNYLTIYTPVNFRTSDVTILQLLAYFLYIAVHYTYGMDPAPHPRLTHMD